MRITHFCALSALLLCSCATRPVDSPAYLQSLKSQAGKDTLKCYFFNTLYGDSSLLVTPGGRTMLIDGGVGGEGRKIVGYLRALGIQELDAVLLSHPDYDHYAGLRYVFRQVKVKDYYHSGLTSWTGPYRSFRQAVDESGCREHRLRQGAVISLDPKLHCDVLWPPVEFRYCSLASPNPYSIVLRVGYGQTAFLFTGDLEEAPEQTLLKTAKEKLRADVLKVPNHGSPRSSSPQFINAVAPKTAVVMGETGNLERGAWRRLAPTVRDRLEAAGAEILKPYELGTVLIESDGNTVRVVKTTPETVDAAKQVPQNSGAPDVE